MNSRFRKWLIGRVGKETSATIRPRVGTRPRADMSPVPPNIYSKQSWFLLRLLFWNNIIPEISRNVTVPGHPHNYSDIGRTRNIAKPTFVSTWPLDD